VSSFNDDTTGDPKLVIWDQDIGQEQAVDVLESQRQHVTGAGDL
jgi:hypothetical protein